jgi:hypothetical protein
VSRANSNATLTDMIDDMSRLVATSPDNEFTLSIEEAVERYARAGLPRTPRSVQRYCAKGHLEARLIETGFGEKYLITPASVEKHIAYIEEVNPTTGRDLSRPVAFNVSSVQGHDEPRHVATPIINEEYGNTERQTGATILDTPRHAATSPDLTEKYIARLEGEIAFLREETITKNAQIKELTERSRETNLLIGGLQRMLAPLLGSPNPYPIKQDTVSD